MPKTKSKITNSAKIKLPNKQFLQVSEQFIQNLYPHSKRLDLSDKSSFILNALAYNNNIIFTPVTVSNKKSLENRINADIQKLMKIKYHPSSLFYFIDSSVKFTDDELKIYGSKLSTADYKVTLFNEKSLNEYLFFARKFPNNIKLDELSNYYKSLYKTEKIEESVIEEILAFVFSTAVDNVEIEPIDNKLLHLIDKIRENFVSRNYNFVLSVYDANWENKEAVEFFIKTYHSRYNRQLKSLLDLIRSHFRKLPFNKKGSVEYGVNLPEVFDDLANILIPPEKHSDARYFGTAKAIVLFFFEYCDFGKKSSSDPLTLFPNKFENYDSAN